MAQSVNYIIELRDKFSRNLNRVNQKMKESNKRIAALDQRLSGMSKKMSDVGRSATMKFTLPVTAGLGLMAKEAINAQETFSKFETVFSGVSKSANDVANNLAKSFGMSRVEAKQLLGTTGDLLTGFGFAQDQALGMSKRVQELSADLASFTNIEGGAKRASEALTKALLGERESLKSLGIVVNEELIKERLRAKGLDKLRGLALKQAQAMETLEIAMSQSKNAIGDFARTQNSAANQIRIAQARFKDLRIEIGTNLIPAITKMFQTISPAINRAVEWVQNNKSLTKTIIKVSLAIAALGPMLFILGKAFALVSLFISPAGLIIAGVTAAIGLIYGMIKGVKLLTKWVVNLGKSFASWVGSLSIIERIGGVFNKFKSLNPFNAQINESQELKKSVQQTVMQKSSVDVSGMIKVNAGQGAQVEKARIFNPNIGLNVAMAGG